MRSYINRLLITVLAALALGACQAQEERLAEHMSRGDQYVEQNDYAAAIIEYKNVLQIDPNHASAHYGLAKAYLNNKQARDGFWELRETVRLDSENFEAKVQLGQLLIIAGDPDEALNQGDAAVAQDASKSSGHLIRAQALEAVKRPDEALEAFEKAVEVDDGESGPFFMLAHALNRRGDRDAAERNFRKFIEVDPGFRSYTALANFLSRDRERELIDACEDFTALDILKKVNDVFIYNPDMVARRDVNDFMRDYSEPDIKTKVLAYVLAATEESAG